MQASLALTFIAGAWVALAWASSETHHENVPDANDVSFLQASADLQLRVEQAPAPAACEVFDVRTYNGPNCVNGVDDCQAACLASATCAGYYDEHSWCCLHDETEVPAQRLVAQSGMPSHSQPTYGWCRGSMGPEVDGQRMSRQQCQVVDVRTYNGPNCVNGIDDCQAACLASATCAGYYDEHAWCCLHDASEVPVQRLVAQSGMPRHSQPTYGWCRGSAGPLVDGQRMSALFELDKTIDESASGKDNILEKQNKKRR